MGGEDFDGADAFDGFGDLCGGCLGWGADEHVNMVWHDLDFLELPVVCGAGFRDDVATGRLDGPGEYLVPVFGAEDDVIPDFIDLMTISLHIHENDAIIKTWLMGKARRRNAGRRPPASSSNAPSSSH